MGSGAIGDLGVFVGRELLLGRVQVMVMGKEFLYDNFHTEATGELGLVAVKIDSRKVGSVIILGNNVMFLEHFGQVVGVVLANAFYSKVSDNDYKEDGAPFMAPQARSHIRVVVLALLSRFSRGLLVRILACRKT